MNCSDLRETPHRRWNPLLQEWVLVSPHRTQRPWQGQVGKSTVAPPPEYDPDCYLCPGNARAQGVRNPTYKDTFVFDNDFPALMPEPPAAEFQQKGLIVGRVERGICRVAMGFHQRPTDGEEHPEWHLHAHFFPPLLRSATVQKFMVGYELLAGPQRDITAESAAARLREAPEAHNLARL